MIVSIIQARVSSTRLPNKVMMDLSGEPVLFRVVERVKKSRLISKVIVATGQGTENDIIEELCKNKNIGIYRGSEDDVLDRYYHAARSLNLSANDGIVRITADCPLIDPEVIDKVVKAFLANNVDYAANTNPPTYPDGLDVEVIGFAALEESWSKATLASEREHVVPYIKKNKDIFRNINVNNSMDLSYMRWTLDEFEDYLLIQSIYKYLYKENRVFLLKDILELTEEHPELMQINNKFIRNEGYFRSLLNDKEVK
ncbi:MAG: cytidylyltransferase domain-containing protein [Clostridia bacterium]